MTELNLALARRFGMRIEGEPAPLPITMLDHALSFAARGLYIFPAEPHLGRPWVKYWRGEATTNADTIMSWWAQTGDPDRDWYTADIGAVPDRSGHFVVCAHKDEGGIDSLADLEAQYGP